MLDTKEVALLAMSVSAKGGKLIAYQRIPKINVELAPMTVVLVELRGQDRPYVVWCHNTQDGGFYRGAYHKHLVDAWRYFAETVTERWPTGFDHEPVPPDADENYFLASNHAEGR